MATLTLTNNKRALRLRMRPLLLPVISKWLQVIKTVSATLCQIFTLIYFRREKRKNTQTDFFISPGYWQCHWQVNWRPNKKTNTKRKTLEFQAKQTTGRKTLVQKLQDCGVPANQIVLITGHKTCHQLTTTLLFEKNKWRIFHKFYPRLRSTRITWCQQKTSWQPCRRLFTTKSLQVRPLDLPWTLTPQ